MAATPISTPSVSKLNCAMDIDDILELTGSFGHYQRNLLLIVFMPVSFFVGFVVRKIFFFYADITYSLKVFKKYRYRVAKQVR
ncbi:hypothetical protein E2C01_072809 [Portunus trituberculatus]|uniref:Uncharacterized protein n=1 Tax=Portunus trituberculatus TaxID=210409 RepID=A0A5B7I860_PORTR|nr:hypothetical protein [Portunus trituberculatus]